MKIYENLPLYEQKKFISIRKTLAIIHLINQTSYSYDEAAILKNSNIKVSYISVFDHALTDKEATALLDPADSHLINNYVHRLEMFNLRLYDTTKVLSYKYCGMKKHRRFSKKTDEQIIKFKPDSNYFKLRKFTSKEAFKKTFENVTLFFRFPILVVPEQNVILWSNFDYGIFLFYKDSSNLADIKSIMNECQLHEIWSIT